MSRAGSAAWGPARRSKTWHQVFLAEFNVRLCSCGTGLSARVSRVFIKAAPFTSPPWVLSLFFISSPHTSANQPNFKANITNVSQPLAHVLHRGLWMQNRSSPSTNTRESHDPCDFKLIGYTEKKMMLGFMSIWFCKPKLSIYNKTRIDF